MDEETISAEILTRSGQDRAAAAALQRLGFRVLHIGATISVSGPRELWSRVFGVSFDITEQPVAPGRSTRFLRPRSEEPAIPDELRNLVSGVYFVQPPEFF
ncbi:hypothetical protein NI17_005810 [Thermobifida halotolerans]|uniref:Uncharacterized protein n=1 Tax=Thermobifida halotolerans TaxID=483545 RepID=A0A399G6R4_9ACTN|nr:hypothetical protein [Thermobifida halotolerans]UOE20716.1 hypothetical protein NI17_005810 [Thermobifida halotolerans]